MSAEARPHDHHSFLLRPHAHPPLTSHPHEHPHIVVMSVFTFILFIGLSVAAINEVSETALGLSRLRVYHQSIAPRNGADYSPGSQPIRFAPLRSDGRLAPVRPATPRNN